MAMRHVLEVIDKLGKISGGIGDSFGQCGTYSEIGRLDTVIAFALSAQCKHLDACKLCRNCFQPYSSQSPENWDFRECFLLAEDPFGLYASDS
jgi:hypothetical protein